jgi:glycosyltransferase involved in cell wall biosynthesis
MSNLPLVSIVTPSYNQGQFLEETILSVLNQDYPNIEYIIMDGGSTDGSVDIIRKYEDRLAYWVSEPDKGQADAINKGWAMASGDILAWLNSDDLYVPGAVRFAAIWLNEHSETGVMYGDLQCIDEFGNPLYMFPTKPFNYMDLLYRCFIPQPSTFMRSNVIDKTGPLDANLHMGLDYDLWLRAGLVTKLEYVPKLLSKFRIHQNMKGLTKYSRKARELIHIHQQLYSRNDLPQEVLAHRNKLMGFVHLRAAQLFLCNRQILPFVGEMLNSFRYYPTNPNLYGAVMKIPVRLFRKVGRIVLAGTR